MKSTCAIHLRFVHYKFSDSLGIALTLSLRIQQNTDHSVNQHKQTYHRRMSVSAKKGGSEGGITHTLEDLEETEPHEGLGRQKMEDELADIAQDAVHR